MNNNTSPKLLDYGCDSFVYSDGKQVKKQYSRLSERLFESGLKDDAETILAVLNQYAEDTNQLITDLHANLIPAQATEINNEIYQTTIEVVPQGDTNFLDNSLRYPCNLGQRLIEGKRVGFKIPFFETFKTLAENLWKRANSLQPRNFELSAGNIIAVLDESAKTCKLCVTDLASDLLQTYRSYFERQK